MSETKTEEQTKPVFGASGRKIIYDENGKPYVLEGFFLFWFVIIVLLTSRCRSCNSLLDFKFAMGKPLKQAQQPIQPPVQLVAKEKAEQMECPADVELLGRSSWTLLHSIAATYPETPTNQQQKDLKQFVKLFGNFYPCWFCKKDFEVYLTKSEPNTSSQDAFGKWLCDAHNEVNEKIGKPKFDCNLWKKRWKDGDEHCN